MPVIREATIDDLEELERQMPTLKGNRVVLRPLEPNDAAEIHAWHQDREFSVLNGVLCPTTLANWEEFVRRSRSLPPSEVTLGIEIESGELIGYLSLKRTRLEDRSSEFGIAIQREFWSQGYGRDATMTLLRFAFQELSLHRVGLTVVEYNARARKMYEAFGFREEGRLRDARFRDGRYWDNISMSILNSEFSDRTEDSTMPVA